MRLFEVNSDERVHDIELKNLQDADEDVLEHVLSKGGIIFYDDTAVKQLIESELLDGAFKKVEATKQYEKLIDDGWISTGQHKYRYMALFFRPAAYEHAHGGALYATLTYAITLRHPEDGKKVGRQRRHEYPRVTTTVRDHLGNITNTKVKFDPAKDIDLSRFFQEYFTEIILNNVYY